MPGSLFLSESGIHSSQFDNEGLSASGGSGATAAPDNRLEEARRENAKLRQV